MSAALFAEPEMREVTEEPMIISRAAGLQRFNKVSRLNAFRGWCAASLLATAPAAGRAVLRRLAHMTPLSDLLQSEEALDQFVRNGVVGMGHVCGTCRMGEPDDKRAVVDVGGRVRGIAGLRVADASVMPKVPSGNTHLPVVMVAEKLAATILRSADQGV